MHVCPRWISTGTEHEHINTIWRAKKHKTGRYYKTPFLWSVSIFSILSNISLWQRGKADGIVGRFLLDISFWVAELVPMYTWDRLKCLSVISTYFHVALGVVGSFVFMTILAMVCDHEDVASVAVKDYGEKYFFFCIYIYSIAVLYFQKITEPLSCAILSPCYCISCACWRFL